MSEAFNHRVVSAYAFWDDLTEGSKFLLSNVKSRDPEYRTQSSFRKPGGKVG